MCGGGGGEIKETKDEKELARIALEERDYYDEFIVPIRDNLIKEIQDVAPQYARVFGITNADTEQAFKQAEDTTRAVSAARGAAPTSGAAIGAMQSTNFDKAQSKGLGLADAGQFVRDREARNLQSMVGLMRGDANRTLQGLSDSAGLSARQAALDAQYSAQNSMLLGRGIGSLAAVGASAYGNPDAGVIDTGTVVDPNTGAVMSPAPPGPSAIDRLRGGGY